MVLKLYGFPTSTCTRRVGLVCEELGISYELVVVNHHRGEQKSPDFLEHQPFGLIPYIDDDGFGIYESRAICRYLAAKHGSSLIPSPTDLRGLGKFEQAASVEQSSFEVYAASISSERIFKPAKGLPTDEALLQRHIEILGQKLDAYDVILSKQDYLVGDECTLMDLFHLPLGT